MQVDHGGRTLAYGVVVHGGAWDIPDDAVDDHLRGVGAACRLAYTMLQNGASAIDVAEECVKLMEDYPTFDAGRGSFLNRDGEVEMDAIIATQDLKLGSVCGVQNIRNPIQLARLVRDKTKEVVLVGHGANKYAKECNIPECSPEDLLVGRELDRYRAIKHKEREGHTPFHAKSAFDKAKPNGMGTVGCVILDSNGQFAIAVSTGGTPYKRSGRVGDTPLWGCGGYVEDIGGAAATGYGEDLIRVLITRQAVDYLRAGFAPQVAAEKTIQDLHNKVHGLGGIILMSRDGVGLHWNTPRMAFAYQTNRESEPVVGINHSDRQSTSTTRCNL